MMRVCFAIIFYIGVFSATFSYASPLSDKVENFVPKNVYQKNANFVKKIFSNEKKFYKGNNLNIQAILSALKSNGLLTLKLKEPANVSATFRINAYSKTDDNPSFFFLNYTINAMLGNMGYSYFYITEVKRDKEKILITYTLNSESNIDPSVLVSGLMARGYNIVDVNRFSQTHWIYDINLKNGIIPNANDINSNSTISNISGKYWLSFSMAGSVSIKTSNMESFYPKVLVFDNNMNIIDSIMETNSTKNYNFNVDSNVRYIFFTDNYNPTNLRSGLDIVFKPSKSK